MGLHGKTDSNAASQPHSTGGRQAQNYRRISGAGELEHGVGERSKNEEPGVYTILFTPSGATLPGMATTAKCDRTIASYKDNDASKILGFKFGQPEDSIAFKSTT